MKNEIKVHIETTPDLSHALYDALWSWKANREFESQSDAVAKIVGIVEDKGRFSIRSDATQTQREKGRALYPLCLSA